MMRNWLLTLLLLFPFVVNGIENADDRRKRQAMLDYACEDARQYALAPRKVEIYRECIIKFKKPELFCERQADEYDGTRIHGAPLFYDLPECQAAFEYRRRYRRSD